jgi:hypothetical protein
LIDLRIGWVLDLCFGSGTRLAAYMVYGRHCAFVEIDNWQSKVLEEWILALQKKKDANFMTQI